MIFFKHFKKRYNCENQFLQIKSSKWLQILLKRQNWVTMFFPIQMSGFGSHLQAAVTKNGKLLL